MCEICKSYPCSPLCPCYTPPKATHRCSKCNEGILNGEEYIVNENGDYAHWECVNTAYDLVEWFGYKIETMGDDSY